MNVATAKKYGAKAPRTFDWRRMSPEEFRIVADLVKPKAAGTVRTGMLLYKGTEEVRDGAGVRLVHVFARVNGFTRRRDTISFNGGRAFPLEKKIPVVVGL